MANNSLAGSLKETWSGQQLKDACGNALVRDYLKFTASYKGMMAAWSPSKAEMDARASRKKETPVIVMTAGKPDPNCLPYDEIMKFSQKAWERSHPAPLEYGASALLRQEIAKYLTRTRGHPVGEGEIFMSSGNSSGLKIIMDGYLGPGDVAIVESPLWTATVNFMKAKGAEVICVGLDSEGVRVDEIEQQMQAALRRGKRIKMIYVQPVNHNPTGVTISRARAEHLLKVASSHGAVVVSDEPYEMYCYDSQPCFLSALSGGHGVLTVHTFSKTLGTGLRLGYVQSQPEFLEPLKAFGGMAASVFWEYAIGELMASGRYNQIIADAKAVYARKVAVFCDALEQHAKRHLAKSPARHGGFFVWIQLATLPAEQVYLKMLSSGVEARLGSNMYGPDHAEQTVEKHKTIGFAFIGPTEAELLEAAKRIGAACDAVESATSSKAGPVSKL